MASPGAWIRGTYQQMPYFVLLPDGYNAATIYPTILFLHQYQADAGQPQQTDPWFNTAQFRDRHPCIVVVPLCVIGSQRSSPTFNWGGVDTNLQQPIVLALQILDLVVAQYNGDRKRQFVTGDSMGGLGTWGILCDPTLRERFAAAMPVSGSCYYNIGNERQIAAELRDFPIWSCHGGQDTQVSPAFDQAVMPLITAANPVSRFTNDAAGQHDTWDSFYPRTDVWDWLFSQRKKGTTMPASADRTVVLAGSGGTIVDAAGNAWTITAGGQVALNGVVDTSTANVTELAWVGGLLWQLNAVGNWYSKASPGAQWTAATTASPLAPPTMFSIRGGQIIDPRGKPWIATGVNNRPMSATNAADILKLFPGMTFVRLAMSSHQDPAVWSGFVNAMEAAGVVCLMEYHPWPMVAALSGADLAAEVATAGRWASFYKNRPYIWVGTMNEPQSGSMSPEHVAVYQAVRAVDTNKIVVFVAGIGGGNPGATGAKVLDRNAYATMKNIVWDLHFYGWATKYSTDQAACDAALMGSVPAGSGVAACRDIVSADGLVPVIIGEFGPSTSGSSMDANASQIITSVTAAAKAGKTAGYAGWAWAADAFNAVQVNGQPTSWGKSLAAAVAGIAPPPPPPPPPGPTLADVIKQLNAAVQALSAMAAGQGNV